MSTMAISNIHVGLSTSDMGELKSDNYSTIVPPLSLQWSRRHICLSGPQMGKERKKDGGLIQDITCRKLVKHCIMEIKFNKKKEYSWQGMPTYKKVSLTDHHI